MKIAITCHPTQGGSGVVATELAIALAKRNHEVHIISCERPFRLGKNTDIHFHKVNVSDYPLFRYPPHDICLANKIAEIVVDHDIDIVHAHYAVPHAISAILAREIITNCPQCEHKKNVKIVATLHGTDVTLVGSQKDFKNICRYAMVKCDGVTTVSNWLNEQTMAEFNLPKLPTIIPNFVDCDRFTAKKRATYPPNRNFKILHASNFRPVKRVFDVIRTFHQIRQRLNANLIMVGNGPQRGMAVELASELGICNYIQWAGEKFDIEQAYRDSHLFLLLSDYESFGLSALEAMACGTPVVASNSGGLTEVINDAHSGCLRTPGDINAFTDAALNILDNKNTWQQFSDNAKTHARDNFCINAIIPLYEDFYQQIMRQ